MGQSDKQTGNTTRAILRSKGWHKLERVTQDYSKWVTARSASPERFIRFPETGDAQPV